MATVHNGAMAYAHTNPEAAVDPVAVATQRAMYDVPANPTSTYANQYTYDTAYGAQYPQPGKDNQYA